MRVTGLHRYPVKSCRGQDMDAATVEPWGLAGDRRWMVVDRDNHVVTGREHPRMVLIDAVPAADGLRLSAPDTQAVSVPRPEQPRTERVTVWGDEVDASTVESDVDDWLSRYLGIDVRLVHLDDPTQRPTDPAYTRDTDRVSFADGYPLLVATEASLAAVNDLVAEGRFADQWPLPMRRFRPNVVVDGDAAWDEDSWRRVRIGAVDFRVVEGCARCSLTLVDPDTAEVGREPLATLVRHRRWDGRSWFAVNLVPDGTGELHVGDEVTVLERGDGSRPLF